MISGISRNAGAIGALSFGLWLTTTGVVLAGPEGRPVAGNTVSEEIARRQQQLEDAEKAIVEGMAQEEQGDMENAILNYQSAYMGIPDSVMTRPVRESALAHFCNASVLHAEGLIKDARYKKAEAVLKTVVDEQFAPDFPPAKKLLSQLADPEYYNRALTPKHIRNVTEVNRLLREGHGMIEIGRFAEATKSFNDVLRIDPTNSAARRGMERAEQEIVAYHAASRGQTRATMFREVDEAWETSVPLARVSTQIESPQAIETMSMAGRLNSMVVPRVDFDGMTLAEAVEWMTAKSRELDPSGIGMNFVLDLSDNDTKARNAELSLRLNSVPMSVLLDYLTRDTGTKYRAETFAVRIVSSSAASDVLLTRTFGVPPDFLSVANAGDADVPDDPFAEKKPGGGLVQRRMSAQEFFEKAGITFPEGAVANYSVANSQITVRNTQENLDQIEGIIKAARSGGALNVEVKLTVMEIKETDLNELGFDWLLGQFNVPGSDRAFASGGTTGNSPAPYVGDTVNSDFPLVPPGSNVPLGVNPITSGNRSGILAQPTDTIDGKLQQNVATAAASTRAPSILGVGGVLTDPQVQFIIRSIKQKSGADLLTTPSTVVRPGQRSKIEAYREFIYPTEYDPPEIPQSVNQGGNGTVNIDPITGLPSFGQNAGGQTFPVTPSHPTAFEMRPVGTTLEVEPVIGEDGISVNLNLSPEIVRFEGFLNYGSPITTGTDILTSNEILMPVFNTIKESTNVTVYDGANVVIGGLLNDSTVATNDSTPIFSDIPIFGSLFRTKTSKRERTALILVVNVRIIDAAGNPIRQR